MATKTASKAGLRAAASERTNKAAQRTPLPPRKGDVEAAKAPVPPAKPVRKAAKPAAWREGLDPYGPETKPAATRRAREVETQAAKIAAAKPTKADGYAATLKGMGWKPGITVTDGLVELIATRTNEALYLAWLREAHVSGTSTYTYADRTVKVRNPAEAMRIAARKPEEATAAQAKVASNKQFRRKATGPTKRHIPFDPETATDREICDALEAHRISWHNPYRVDQETATVGNARAISISRHAAGHRIVSFVDPEFGFRAFRLDMLENVGAKRDLERIRHSIIASLAKDDKSSRKSKAA